MNLYKFWIFLRILGLKRKSRFAWKLYNYKEYFDIENEIMKLERKLND